MKKEYIYLVIGLIVGIILSLVLKSYNSSDDINSPLNNANALLRPLDVDIHDLDKYEFWNNNEIIEVEFYIDKKNARSNSIERTISKTDCEEEFDKRNYPVDYRTSYEGGTIPRRFCKVDYVSADIVSENTMDLGSRCNCWYTVKK